MALTREHRDRIQRLIQEELRTACVSAVDRGARPADVAEFLVDRRHALDGPVFDVADDPQHPLDHDDEAERPP